MTRPSTLRFWSLVMVLPLSLTCLGAAMLRAQSAVTSQGPAASEQPHPQIQGADEAAIRALAFQCRDAWNRGDVAGVAAMFVDASDLISGDGVHSRGRAAIADYLGGLMTRLGQGSRFTTQVESVRFITPALAILHAHGGFLMPGETELPLDRRGVQAILAIKNGGAWRITSFQVTRILPPAPVSKPS